MEYSSKSPSWYLAALAFATAAAVATTPCAAQNAPADYVNLHNAARAAVGVGSVAWDNVLGNYSQIYANARQGDCNLVRSGGPYGENLFRATGSTATAADAVKLWVDEKQYYDHGTNTCAAGKKCEEYTQVVWSSSTAIGCARVVCYNGPNVFIVCTYNPKGNLAGQSPY